MCRWDSYLIHTPSVIKGNEREREREENKSVSSTFDVLLEHVADVMRKLRKMI